MKASLRCRHAALVTVMLIGIGLASTVSLVMSTTEAAAQPPGCASKYGACYNWHQCEKNRCAGYRVRCTPFANACTNRCYVAYRYTLISLLGPIVKRFC
jgi:hypothetical protein